MDYMHVLVRPVVPGVPQILADQLTLSQPVGADYAHHITTGTPGFADLPTSLNYCNFRWTNMLNLDL